MPMLSATQAQVDRLRRRAGAGEDQYIAYVIRNGARRSEISISGSVSMNRFNDIQRTGRFILKDELDWLLDELQPVMRVRGDDLIKVTVISLTDWNARDALVWTWDKWDAMGVTWDEVDGGETNRERRAPQYDEYSLGMFVLSTPTRATTDGAASWTVEAYDHTVILQEDSLDAPLYIAAGTAYLDAIQSVLVGAGAANVIVADYIGTALAADREWEIGTKKLEIINALLTEINYDKLWCDVDGNFVLSAYTEPSPAEIDWTYEEGELSIIERDTSSILDLYKVPNVFLGICSNPDLNVDYHSTYINDNPLSPLSTVRRGRRIVSEVHQLESVTTQADLDAAVVRIAFEANQVEEVLTFHTANNPLHSRKDTLAIWHSDANGIYVDGEWELPLEAGGQMNHTTRKLVIL